MKWSISNPAQVAAFLIFLAWEISFSRVEAQETLRHDTIFIVQHDTLYLPAPADKDSIYQSPADLRGFDKRIHRYRKSWENLIPTHNKIQLAGNMGLLSIGFGWDYGHHNQWETDLLFGYLPKHDSKRDKITFTVKQNYIPWSRPLHPRLSLEPLTCGLYLNTMFGDEFWVKEPERYPEGYYGFSSKVRIHVFIGQRLTYTVDPRRRFFSKEVTLFYELSTCDLYMVSAFTNRYLKPRDYLCLSFGLKLQFL